jgi:hypothetical protein
MNSTRIPKRRRPGQRIERIFERWMAAEFRRKRYWIIGGVLLWLAALIAIYLKTRS